MNLRTISFWLHRPFVWEKERDKYFNVKVDSHVGRISAFDRGSIREAGVLPLRAPLYPLFLLNGLFREKEGDVLTELSAVGPQVSSGFTTRPFRYRYDAYSVCRNIYRPVWRIIFQTMGFDRSFTNQAGSNVIKNYIYIHINIIKVYILIGPQHN